MVVVMGYGKNTSRTGGMDEIDRMGPRSGLIRGISFFLSKLWPCRDWGSMSARWI